mmetsp:Transcript_23475/g.48802  ORF Transcript_23475/g.48802 Transcript_23475/m.48802 type:complete len:180 (-) Transcript_23475:225-764(-)|eukprot:CAMPEP_0197564052 /NCGR_PEP_ID=MMETSP1320-20131121/29785_1 /TAXON_ID=91990 /ORGANISM="Bolidomonas sp., Strain RCC2347" /LENGTH=179 /DNA_ID=CAMNT_0043125937 /DNA_START=270 /DNA_END=809 /DNA_ORIENTATION=-
MQEGSKGGHRPSYRVSDTAHPLKYLEAPRPELNFDHGPGLTGFVKGLYHALLHAVQVSSFGEASRTSSSSSLESNDDGSYDTPTQSPGSTDAFPSHRPGRRRGKMRRSKESLSSLSSLSSFNTPPESPSQLNLTRACLDSDSGSSNDYGHFFDFRDRFDDSVLTAGPKSGARPHPIHEE